jgi:hypothetical protein
LSETKNIAIGLENGSENWHRNFEQLELSEKLD